MTDTTPSHSTPSPEHVDRIDPVDPVDSAAPADPVANAEHLLTQALARTVQSLPGVYALGSPATRMLGVARSTLTRTEHLAGVTVTANPPHLDVTVSLVAEYPANVTELADAARAAITTELAPHHIGPLRIDVTVTDVHGPFDTPIVAADDVVVEADVDDDVVVDDDDDATVQGDAGSDADAADRGDADRLDDAASEPIVASGPIDVTIPDSDRDVTVTIQVEVEPADEASVEPARTADAADANADEAEADAAAAAAAVEAPARASADSDPRTGTRTTEAP